MRVLRDDDLVESAMFDNLIKAEQLFSENVLKEKAQKLYSSIMETKN